MRGLKKRTRAVTTATVVPDQEAREREVCPQEAQNQSRPGENHQNPKAEK